MNLLFDRARACAVGFSIDGMDLGVGGVSYLRIGILICCGVG